MFYLLPRLHATGKYEITELAAYCNPADGRILDVPWKVIPNQPHPSDGHAIGIYQQDRANQFGKWKLNEALIETQCDLAISIRDPYFDDFIPKSPLRRHFKWIHMTTCDSSPQKAEWMEMFANADVLLTYSQWGKNVLEYQSNGHLKVAGVLSPGIDLKEFVHYPTTEARNFFGIDHDAIIFGTINRNQPRKLFPDLMKCFVRYLEICKANGRDDLATKSYLYFHTSSPDVGWDLGSEIKRHRLAHKVLFTQVCHQCGAIFPSFWQGDQTICRFCKQNKVGFPNTNNGVDRAALNRILAAWDVCVQYSIAEGWNLGINEAKASGTFVMAAEHTAMIEQCHNGGAWPLKIERKFQEPLNQTNQIRYLPDNEDCAQSMFRYATLSQAEKDKLSSEARSCVEQLYDWDKIAKEWEALIDATPDVSEANSWTSPAKVRNLQLQLPNNMTIDQLVGWCYTHILERPDMIGSTEYQTTISSLTLGYEVGINELGQTVQMPVTVEKFINSCAAIVSEKNKIEQYRYTKICEPEKLNQRPEVVFKEV